MKDGVHAICGLSVIPVRALANDSSEMVTQLLFGELVQIIDTNNQWRKVHILHDGYEGWVDHKQLLPISDILADKLLANTNNRSQEKITYSTTPFGKIEALEGSPILNEQPTFLLDQYEFKSLSTSLNKSNSIADLSIKYLNSPYLWGGRTKYGIDCSGLTQTVYHQIGYRLKRDASLQVQQGKEVTFEAKREGDLAFFKSERSGKITHVGIVLKEDTIIHAHGRVRIDKLDKTGIFNQTEKYYSHKLFKIKQYI